MMILVHNDGHCADGKLLTPLVDGFCPACKFHPDMQSTALVPDGGIGIVAAHRDAAADDVTRER